jgi:Spy/CpxP family protein refolding chaperone
MKRMRWMSAFMPMLLVVAVGCGGKGTGASSPGGSGDVAAATARTDSDPGEENDESTKDLAEHHRHHHHGGFPMFIAMSLDSIGATDTQQAAIKGVRDDLFARLAPAHDAEKALLLLLADDVAANSFDQGKIDADMQTLATASGGVHDAVADSLNQLHNVLTPEQRVALIDKVEGHLEVWHHVNNEDVAEEKGKPHDGHLAKIEHEYNLTPDQVTAIKGALAATPPPQFDRAEADAHLKSFGEAFESETFDAHTIKTGAAVNGHMATWGLGRMVRFYKAVTPTLTADQRTKMAEAIRKHATYKRTETES